MQHLVKGVASFHEKRVCSLFLIVKIMVDNLRGSVPRFFIN